MKPPRSVEALIELEDDSPSVLFESVRDLHIWPLIRVGLGLSSFRGEVGGGLVRSTWTRSDPVKQLTELATPNRFNSRRVIQNRDFLFLTVGSTNRPTPAGRENWLVDGFASAEGDNAVALQDGPISARPAREDVPAFQATYSLRDAYLRVLVKSRLAPLPADAKADVRTVVREILDRYPYDVPDSLAATLEGQAIQHVTRAPHWRREFERILARTSPKVVVMDLASYMTRAAITQTIRRYQLPIAEPQHGWIGPSHAAYNFGAAFNQPELGQYLPDVLLTFGDFWSEGLRHPAHQHPLGKPHLESAAAAAIGTPRAQVLIASSIYRTDELIRLAMSLRDALPRTITVAVRPHPSERAQISTLYASLTGEERISIDVEPDAYKAFSRSTAVIGYASTVLFEALAFDIPVFVIDSPLADLYTPTSVFGDRIIPDGSLNAVVDRIVDHSLNRGTARSMGIALDRIWKPNAIENFRQFFASMESGGTRPQS